MKLTGSKGMTVTLEHTENIGAVQPGVPHNTYYPGDGAKMTKNGGKGGIDGLAVVELSQSGAGLCAATACALLADAVRLRLLPCLCKLPLTLLCAQGRKRGVAADTLGMSRKTSRC